MKYKAHILLGGLLFIGLALIVYGFNLIDFEPKPEPIDKEYHQTILRGGEWFLNNQNDNFLYYQYDLGTESYSDSSHLLREIATLWAVSDMADFTNDPRYTELEQKGIKYFEQFVKEDTALDFYYVDDNGKAKLGNSAFLILALLNIDHPEKDLMLDKLANGILQMQQDSGKFYTIFYSEDIPSEKYYPGEALLALMSMYEHTKDKKYLEAVKKAFPYYQHFFTQKPSTGFVTWHTRAYYKYYQVNPEPEIAQYIMDMNDLIIKNNNPQVECQNFRFTRGTSPFANLEAINHAYLVAKHIDDDERAQCYYNFIVEAAEFIQQRQVISPTMPKQAIGGFAGGDELQRLRVDYNQHALMALMLSYNLGLIK